ncbi:hypothetical protein [Glycomyces buryatensis]|uniref:Uncharacterized protein n=1 Tax=Glycomyces buryatensis TaxID=2570927 RepID=A0A4S8QLZ4_9ACTN|nr:hypothetical protein [Glycomyces buryatensis]THV42419.1 hypothetical protein FAB82_07130 [Glycomyces buryatensis]
MSLPYFDGPPPGAVFALRILLVVHAIVAICLAANAYLLLLAFTVMVGGTDEEVVQMMIVMAILFLPSLPLNLLAAIHVGQRPARARAFLGLAVFGAVFQTLAGALYVFSTRGIGLLSAALATGLFIAWVVASKRAEVWSAPDESPEHPVRLALLDLGIGIAAIVVAAGIGVGTMLVRFGWPL